MDAVELLLALLLSHTLSHTLSRTLFRTLSLHTLSKRSPPTPSHTLNQVDAVELLLALLLSRDALAREGLQVNLEPYSPEASPQTMNPTHFMPLLKP